MASVLLKSLKFTRILNGRLPFSTSKLYFNSRHFIRPYEHSRNERACYAIAAYKHVTNDESLLKNETITSTGSQDLTSIDDILSKIDILTQQFGRIKKELINKAFSMATSKEMTTSTHGLYLLRSCKVCYSEPPSKRIELVNQIWNRYQELGIQFDTRHYNALLDVHVSSGASLNPVEILNSMQDSNVEPNKVTYMLVMKKYCEDGNISGASEILQHMKEKGLSVNEDIFNNLIQGHVKNNDFSGAKDVIEVMRSSNLQLTADTYGILACGYAASGNKDEMMTYLKEIKDESKVQNYLKVIDTLASSGNHQLIDDVLSRIEGKEFYQQEFINSAIELIHKGFIDTAFKLITASYTPEYLQGTHIFLKQLIRTGKPVSEIIHFCLKIMDGGYSNMSFLVASKSVIENGRYDCIVPIFKKLAEKGYFIKSSNFWPLFRALEAEKSQNGVWLILKHMSELGVPVDFTTYINVVYPTLGEPHPNDVILNTERCGQSKQTAIDALFLYYFNLGKIDYVLHLIETAPVYMRNNLDIEKFLDLYSLDKNVGDKYLRVLKYMFMDGSYLREVSDFRGRLLAELILKNPRLIDILLDKYNDLTFDKQAIRSCDWILSQKKLFNKEYVRILKRLQRITVEREMCKKDLSIAEEEAYIKHMLAQNLPCKFFFIKRIDYHIKAKDLDRVSKLLSVYDELNFTYPPLLLSNLINLYCLGSDVEKAIETFTKLRKDFPSFKLDVAKCLDYVTLLIKYYKLDESIEVLKTITEPYQYSDKDIVESKVRNLNLAISNTNNAEFAKTMQNLLLQFSKEFISKKTVSDFVLNLHLQRGNLTSAYEEYKNCMKSLRTPIGLRIFLKRCIDLNDKNMLQKVIDFTISYVGESYTMLELSLAFIENHNLRKASAVIMNLGQRADPRDVMSLCTQLRNKDKLSELEHFIHITRELNHDNREKLYYLAIKAYANKKEYNKVVNLYNQLKKEVVELSPKIVEFIHEFFGNNNQPVPLALLDNLSDANPLSTEATQVFMKHLEARNVEEALKELGELKKGHIRTLSKETLTDLIDLCLQENYCSNLSCNVNAMSYIIDSARDVLKPLLEKYSKTGDVEKFITMSQHFPDFSLINLGYNSYFCQAFFTCGKHEELLSHLEQCADKRNRFFCVLAFEELLKYPEYEDRVFDLAVKYYDSKFFIPMSAVWSQYFSKENYDKADKIFQNFEINIDRIDNAILRAVKQNQNVALAQKYINVLKSANVRNRVKEKAYGAVLDVLVLKGMYDEAVALVLESEELNLQLNKYYLSTLVTLKNVLEKENKPVPFHIPLGVISDSSSDSE